MSEKKGIKLSAEKKLKQALNLYFNARELKAASIRHFYPELSETEIMQKVRDIFLYAKS